MLLLMVTTGIRVGVWVIKNTVSATVRVVYGGADVHDGDFWGGKRPTFPVAQRHGPQAAAFRH